ncbi:MAG: DNA recombination protein RmuC [Dehalococcoidia bacterium]
MITIVLLGACAVLLAALYLALRGPSRSVERPELSQIATALARLEAGQATQTEIGRKVDDAHRSVEVLRAQTQERLREQELTQQTVRRIESMFLGSVQRGKAGENVLAEALGCFPADMLEADFRVNGRVVEYGLRLSDGKVLPIDSKWPSAELLARCDEADPVLRRAIVQELEKETARRVREVAGYIDVRSTTPYALAAVPDAVLNLCSAVHVAAHRVGVIVMSYSMTVPFLLLVYRLNAQHSRSLDLDQLAARLSELDRQLVSLDSLLENSVLRGGKMVTKAAAEAQETVSRMRRAVQSLEAPLESGAPTPLPTADSDGPVSLSA